MAQTIIDFSKEQEGIIKAYKSWKLNKKDSKATVIKSILDSLKIPEKYFEVE
jgi:hypothetical protein